MSFWCTPNISFAGVAAYEFVLIFARSVRNGIGICSTLYHTLSIHKTTLSCSHIHTHTHTPHTHTHTTHVKTTHVYVHFINYNFINQSTSITPSPTQTQPLALAMRLSLALFSSPRPMFQRYAWPVLCPAEGRLHTGGSEANGSDDPLGGPSVGYGKSFLHGHLMGKHVHKEGIAV